MNEIKVIIVDDHELVRDGIELNLLSNKTINVIATASDAITFFKLLENQKPDVVLMDIDLPGKSGISITSEIKSISKYPKIIILTSNDQISFLEKALKAGADGFLSKSSNKERIKEAIQKVYSGETYLDPSMTTDALESLRNKLSLIKDEQELSEREIEILKCFANGMGYREVSDELSISKKTVEAHKASLFKKLNFSNNADLIKYAIKHGYVSMD